MGPRARGRTRIIPGSPADPHGSPRIPHGSPSGSPLLPGQVGAPQGLRGASENSESLKIQASEQHKNSRVPAAGPGNNPPAIRPGVPKLLHFKIQKSLFPRTIFGRLNLVTQKHPPLQTYRVQ